MKERDSRPRPIGRPFIAHSRSGALSAGIPEEAKVMERRYRACVRVVLRGTESADTESKPVQPGRKRG